MIVETKYLREVNFAIVNICFTNKTYANFILN